MVEDLSRMDVRVYDKIIMDRRHVETGLTLGCSAEGEGTLSAFSMFY